MDLTSLLCRLLYLAVSLTYRVPTSGSLHWLFCIWLVQALVMALSFIPVGAAPYMEQEYYGYGEPIGVSYDVFHWKGVSNILLRLKRLVKLLIISATLGNRDEYWKFTSIPAYSFVQIKLLGLTSNKLILNQNAVALIVSLPFFPVFFFIWTSFITIFQLRSRGYVVQVSPYIEPIYHDAWLSIPRHPAQN